MSLIFIFKQKVAKLNKTMDQKRKWRDSLTDSDLEAEIQQTADYVKHINAEIESAKADSLQQK